MIDMHDMAPNLTRLREIRRDSFDRLLAVEHSERRTRFVSEENRRECLVFALYALVLDQDEKECRRLLREAAQSAENALHAPRSKSDHPLAAKEIGVSVDPATMTTQVDSAPINTLYDEARMSVVDYEAGLYTLWAFGSEAALRDAARIPEKDYRSSGVVQSEANWRATEAEKLLALGEERAALDIYEAIVDGDTLPMYRERIEGIRHLVSGNQKKFLKSLAKLLTLHRAKAAKRPADIAGLVCFPGMIAARLALRRGLVVEDQNYLPLRFMPGHPANPASTAG